MHTLVLDVSLICAMECMDDYLDDSESECMDDSESECMDDSEYGISEEDGESEVSELNDCQ